MCNNLHPHYATNENTTGITILSNDCTILPQLFTQKANWLYNGTITNEENIGGFYV
jgi:hypothetical protein